MFKQGGLIRSLKAVVHGLVKGLIQQVAAHHLGRLRLPQATAINSGADCTACDIHLLECIRNRHGSNSSSMAISSFQTAFEQFNRYQGPGSIVHQYQRKGRGESGQTRLYRILPACATWGEGKTRQLLLRQKSGANILAFLQMSGRRDHHDFSKVRHLQQGTATVYQYWFTCQQQELLGSGRSHTAASAACSKNGAAGRQG